MTQEQSPGKRATKPLEREPQRKEKTMTANAEILKMKTHGED